MTSNVYMYQKQNFCEALKHTALVKFGVDNPQGIKEEFKQNFSQQNSICLITQFYLPQVKFALDTKDMIIVQRKIKKNMYSQIKVDRKTGFFCSCKKAFSHISRFDPDTFPSKKEIKILAIEKLGYWDRLNTYIKPLV